MKITKNQLKHIIQEELSGVLQEDWTDDLSLGWEAAKGYASQAPEIYQALQGIATQPGDIAGGYDHERAKGAFTDLDLATIEAERGAYDQWAQSDPNVRSYDQYVFDEHGVDLSGQGAIEGDARYVGSD